MMKEDIVVSGRGQITLPASMRKRLGIKAGGVLVVEDRKVVTSAYCLEEARLNLERKVPAALGRLSEILRAVRLVPDVAGERCGISLFEKDRPVFAAAQRCKATHFLTGDRQHFGRYMNKPKVTMGMVIQTVGDFLSEITK